MIDDLWYKNAVFYSVQVESLMDANGDGLGDFEGLSRRLPSLEALGVAVLWLSPFYPTPNRDDGYDVEDYTLALRYDWRGSSVLVVHNFGDHPCARGSAPACPGANG